MTARVRKADSGNEDATNANVVPHSIRLDFRRGDDAEKGIRNIKIKIKIKDKYKDENEKEKPKWKMA